MASEVSRCAHLGSKVTELAETDDLSKLKAIEYGLLIRPIAQGLEAYLNETGVPLEDDFLLPSELTNKIGEMLGEKVVAEYESDVHKPIIDEIAAKRAESLPYPQMTYPVETTLRSAATFSAGALYSVAMANAYAIKKGGGFANRPRQDFVEAVKRSTQLALSAPIVHLEWNVKLNTATYRYATANSANDSKLVYDAEKDKAVLVEPITEWVDDEAYDLFSQSSRPTDPSNFTFESFSTQDSRVGCPASFSPELVKQYYSHIVDMVEAHEAWPDALADKEKMNIRMLDFLSNFGIAPETRG